MVRLQRFTDLVGNQGASWIGLHGVVDRGDLVVQRAETGANHLTG